MVEEWVLQYMAISINWGTKVISVPKADLTLISGTLYELDTDWFRLQLKDLEDSDPGMAYLDTHIHKTESVLSGVTYARIFEIINGYTVTFEDGNYAVNLVGTNNNILDVTNRNQVGVGSGNSAGLQIVTSGSGLDAGQDALLTAIAKSIFNRRKWDKVGNTVTVYDDDDVTPLYVFDTNADLSELTPQ